MERSKISAFIVCYNEQQQIKRCLESIRWCDEIVVVDSGSTDGTLETCREYTDKIFIRPWPGYVAQKRFGLEQCSSEWALNIDADEVVSPELKDEILSVLKNDQGRINGYYISRVVFFLEKWWRSGGWYPEYRLRLCRKRFTEWGGADPHEKAIVEGDTKKLKGELFHYTYTNISNQVQRLNSHSTQAAATMFAAGKIGRKREIFVNPVVRFVKWYFFKKGYLEGFPGFVVALLESYYVFLKYVKLWELSRKERG